MIKPRVLFIDEDQVAQATYVRLVRGFIDPCTVSTLDAAHRTLKQEGPFSVIVTEYGLPDGLGTNLLRDVVSESPETVGVILTGSEEPRAGVEAVNTAKAYRFLLKPCKPDAFVAAVRDAVLHSVSLRRARELREQTADGVVEMLTGYHTGAEPEISGKAATMRDRAKLIAQELKLTYTADLELAALLMRLGMSTIPKHVRDKLHNNEKIEASEEALIDRIPEVAAHLLDHNERLRGVAEIIRHEAKVFSQDSDSSRGPTRDDVPLAARILRALVDLHVLEELGLNTSAALVRLRQVVGRYDRDVMKTMERLFADPAALALASMEEHVVDELMPGMVLAADALSDEGVPLVSKGTLLTPAIVHHLRCFAELGELVEPIYVFPTTPATAGASG